MMEHFKILGLVIQIMVAVWVITYIQYSNRTHRSQTLRYLASYSAVVCIAFITGLLFIYSSINFTELLNGTAEKNLMLVVDLIITTSTTCLVYFMIKIILSFRGISLPGSITKATWILVFLLFAFYVSRILFPQLNPLFRWLDFLRYKIFENLVLAEPVILAVSIFFWPAGTNRMLKKVGNIFSILYLLRYLVLGITLYLSNHLEVGKVAGFFIGFTVFLMISLLPFFWVRYYYLPYILSVSVYVESGVNFDQVFDRYHISKREGEVIRMILEGKSNREIENSLFISYHTVKNHISNIYSKLNVRTRYELIQLFIRLKG